MKDSVKEHLERLIEAIGGGVEAVDGICDICERDTTPYSNKSLQRLSYLCREMNVCTSCRTVLFNKVGEWYGKYTIESFRAKHGCWGGSMDHLPAHAIAQWLAQRLSKAKGKGKENTT